MATKKAAPPPRAKKSKAEVQQEFETIREDIAAQREASDPKREETMRLSEAGLREAVDGVSVEGVAHRISGLGFEVSKSLAELSGRLTREVDLLESVRSAVELERKELSRLHKIDVAATALDQMVQEYEREKQRLDTEISERRAEWDEEVRNRERELKEQEDNQKKQRQREIDDYEYRKTLDRKKAQDKYDEEIRVQEKRNKEKQEALEKSWEAREASLKEAEQELNRLRTLSQDLPARLEREAGEAAARATREAEARFENQILIARKDAEAEKRLAEHHIRSLEEMISRQASQIAALQQQLDEAKKQVQEIAVRAIEGASGARALSHVNQIAMEQAKTRAPQS
ncbi:MAG: hypothetical protein ACRD7E_04675 [Bryobacteraceae bacterium]